VLNGGTEVAVNGLKPRQLLAALMLNADRIVSTDRLVDALWGEAPPRSALENLRTHATTLRQLMAPAGSAAPRLSTSKTGFLLELSGATLDLDRFRTAVADGRGELAAGRTEPALHHFTKALEQWRAAAGQGLPRHGWLGAALSALDEQHLAVTEDRAEAQLRLGRHHEVAPHLIRTATEHPLRERLWRLLMLAQYRCGNVAEALDSYRQTRDALAEQLGVDPAPESEALHRAILSHDPVLAGPPEFPPPAAPAAPARPRPVVPRQLPARAARFAGRHEQLADVTAALCRATRGERVAVAIRGPAGVGTSALALQAAHAVSDRFPDGQLYVDLRELAAGPADGPPGGSGHAVAVRLLRAIGFRGTPPRSAAEAGAAFRSEVAGRRVLVVLDNASRAIPLGPLLPAHPGSAVLLTSRALLTAPGINHTLRVGPLDDGSLAWIIEAAIGPCLAAAERRAVAAIARLCAGLPLAAEAAAARLAARPGWPADTTRERLAGGRRLAELSPAGDPVRARLASALAEAAQQEPAATGVFPRLARCVAPFDVPAATQVCEPGTPVEAALDALADVGLLDTVRPAHYRFPDLTGLLAAERLAMIADTSGLYRRSPRRCTHVS